MGAEQGLDVLTAVGVEVQVMPATWMQHGHHRLVAALQHRWQKQALAVGLHHGPPAPGRQLPSSMDTWAPNQATWIRRRKRLWARGR
jgi:hypothetical protein